MILGVELRHIMNRSMLYQLNSGIFDIWVYKVIYRAFLIISEANFVVFFEIHTYI